jgi:hypothetical protein
VSPGGTDLVEQSFEVTEVPAADQLGVRLREPVTAPHRGSLRDDARVRAEFLLLTNTARPER